MAGWAWYSLPEVQGWSSVPGGGVKSGICRDSTGCDRGAAGMAARIFQTWRLCEGISAWRRFPQEALRLARSVGAVHLQRPCWSLRCVLTLHRTVTQHLEGYPNASAHGGGVLSSVAISFRFFNDFYTRGQRVEPRYVARVDTLDKKDLDDVQTVYQAGERNFFVEVWTAAHSYLPGCAGRSWNLWEALDPIRRCLDLSIRLIYRFSQAPAGRLLSPSLALSLSLSLSPLSLSSMSLAVLYSIVQYTVYTWYMFNLYVLFVYHIVDLYITCKVLEAEDLGFSQVYHLIPFCNTRSNF